MPPGGVGAGTPAIDLPARWLACGRDLYGRGMFEHRRRLVVQALVLVAVVAFAAGAAQASPVSTQPGTQQRPALVRVRLLSPVIDLYHSAAITVTGLSARQIDVRLLGAIDRNGLAFAWTPYPWRPLRRSGSSWNGVLPAPPLLGIYQLQLRLDHGRTLLSSPRWLLHVFAPGTMGRRSFSTAVAAIRDFVTHLAGNQHLVALRRWPRPAFDHRDPRLHRFFVIAYTPRGDQRPDSRRGLFVTTVRDGFQGRWRLLEATIRPYD